MEDKYPHLSELQKAEFHIFKTFVKICEENNLKYWLHSGSLLGAIRHKGFIPWDDDMDVSMTRADYDKFKAIAEKELPSSMYLSTFDHPDHIWLVPRIIDRNTKFYLNNATEKKAIGAWLDILIADGYPDSAIGRMLFNPLYLFSRMLYQFSNFSKSVNVNKKRSGWQMALIKFAKYSHIEKILSPKTCGHFYDWVCTRNKTEKTKNWATLSGSIKLGLGDVFPREWFGEGRIVPFEDQKVVIWDQTEKYLEYAYGDYMTPPPVNERSQHNVTNAED